MCTSGREVNGTCVGGTGGAADPTIQQARPGESCSREPNTVVIIECIGNSICANGFCTCPNGEQIQNGVCVTLNSRAGPGEACVAGTTTCTGNSYCLNGICICQSQQASYSGQCRVVSGSGSAYPYEPCNGVKVCVGNSYCNNNLCQCNTGLVYNPSTRQCQIITGGFDNGNQVELGSSCAPSYSSCGPFAECVNQMCACQTGYVVYDNNCIPYAGNANPGDSCQQPGVVCLGGATCTEGICACSTGYTPSGTTCIPYNPNPPQSPIQREFF